MAIHREEQYVNVLCPVKAKKMQLKEEKDRQKKGKNENME